MITLGLLLIIVAVIIYVVIGIWYGIARPEEPNSVANWFLAAATFLLIVGLVIGAFSLMLSNEGEHDKTILGCVRGVNSPLAFGSEKSFRL